MLAGAVPQAFKRELNSSGRVERLVFDAISEVRNGRQKGCKGTTVPPLRYSTNNHCTRTPEPYAHKNKNAAHK